MDGYENRRLALTLAMEESKDLGITEAAEIVERAAIYLAFLEGEQLRQPPAGKAQLGTDADL